MSDVRSAPGVDRLASLYPQLAAHISAFRAGPHASWASVPLDIFASTGSGMSLMSWRNSS